MAETGTRRGRVSLIGIRTYGIGAYGSAKPGVCESPIRPSRSRTAEPTLRRLQTRVGWRLPTRHLVRGLQPERRYTATGQLLRGVGDGPARPRGVRDPGSAGSEIASIPSEIASNSCEIASIRSEIASIRPAIASICFDIALIRSDIASIRSDIGTNGSAAG